MGTSRKTVASRTTAVARTAAARVKSRAAELETRLLVDEGRRSVRAKAATTKRVAKKALKTGLVTGAAAAAAVVVHEVRKRRSR